MVIEGKMNGNKTKKPRQIMLDWMLADSYIKLVPLAADLAGRQPRFVLSRLASRKNSGLAASWLRKIFG